MTGEKNEQKSKTEPTECHICIKWWFCNTNTKYYKNRNKLKHGIEDPTFLLAVHFVILSLLTTHKYSMACAPLVRMSSVASHGH